MKKLLVLLLLIPNVAYAQGFECDDNFGDCGTPEQSGGGGGGGGSVLIANTDLGDTYQHADDYDVDGLEDSGDNCMRVSNPDQLDFDGDSRGDVCDNCFDIFNPEQKNIDGDDWGDVCDDDIDGDGLILNDPCPNIPYVDDCDMLDTPEIERVYVAPLAPDQYEFPTYDTYLPPRNPTADDAIGCNAQESINLSGIFLFLLIPLLNRRNKLQRLSLY